jgi:hypothetical protein
MTPLSVGIMIIAWGVCQYFAQRMAVNRNRSPKLWGLLGALFGPLPLAVLAALPDRHRDAEERILN